MKLHRGDGKLLFHLPASGTPAEAPPSPSFASAKGRRKKKARRLPVAADPRPLPPLLWCVRAWFSAWNCLRFGPWWEFDVRRLMRFYGRWPSPSNGAITVAPA